MSRGKKSDLDLIRDDMNALFTRIDSPRRKVRDEEWEFMLGEQEALSLYQPLISMSDGSVGMRLEILLALLLAYRKYRRMVGFADEPPFRRRRPR